MFAYCGNNPINFVDQGGTRREYVRNIDGITNAPNNPIQPSDNLVEIVRQELLDNGFSIYKGVLVLRIDSLGRGGFSFGVIGLGYDSLNDPDFEKTLNHEYGHYVHMQQVGAVDYFFTAAIPSLAFAYLASKSEAINKHYYDLPWENTADRLGGVTRGYLPGAANFSSIYYEMTLMISQYTYW